MMMISEKWQKRLGLEHVEYNRYRKRSMFLWWGCASVLDGLITLGTLGQYRGWYCSQASQDILMYAVNLRKAEREDADNHGQATI